MSNSPHILRDFDHAMASIKGEVLTMAAQSRHNLERAFQSLIERNRELANSVIADDDEVDQAERKIDQLGMDILVKYHPMATDLRSVISSMKISSNLERISDHAVSIAKRTKKIISTRELGEIHLIEPLYTLANQLLRDATSAYSDGNVELSASLHTRDKELDRLHKRTIKHFSQRIEEGNGRCQEYIHLIFIVRSLERVGDLAANIGEDTVFLKNANDLRHKSKDDRNLSNS